MQGGEPRRVSYTRRVTIPTRTRSARSYCLWVNDPVQVLRSTRHPGQLCPRGLHRSGVTEWDRPHCIIPDRSTAPRPGHPRPLVLHPLPIRIHAAPEGRIEGEGHGFHSATARLTEANWSSNVYDFVPRGTTASRTTSHSSSSHRPADAPAAHTRRFSPYCVAIAISITACRSSGVSARGRRTAAARR